MGYRRSEWCGFFPDRDFSLIGVAENILINGTSPTFQLFNGVGANLIGAGSVSSPAPNNAILLLNGTSPLNASTSVGSTFASGNAGVNTFIPAQASIFRAKSSGGVVASLSSSNQMYAFGGPGDYMITFVFDNLGDAHYDIADITVGGGPDWVLTINEWTYEDTPDTAVHVPDVPVPPSGLAALSLLAMGAAGMRSLWKRKEAQAKAA